MLAGHENQSIPLDTVLLPLVTIEDGERFRSLAAQVESISGVFCEPVYELHGHIVSNDRGMADIIPKLKEYSEQTPAGGIGLFVGSGNVVSLLPDLRVDLPIVVDRNTAVFEFNSALSRIINDGVGDLEALNDQSLVCNYVALKLGELYGWDGSGQTITEYGIPFLEDRILSEAQRYGPEHWSRPHKLKEASRALQEKSPVYVAADIANEGFTNALSAICGQHGKTITFANFTNVHEWIEGSDMSFLRTLPFDPDATIIFSSVGEKPLETRLVRSLEEYIQAASDSWIKLTEDAAWVYET
jgi:hypothetical protein